MAVVGVIGVQVEILGASCPRAVSWRHSAGHSTKIRTSINPRYGLHYSRRRSASLVSPVPKSYSAASASLETVANTLVAEEASDDVASANTSNDSVVYDAVVIGAGIGGLVAATQLALKGAKVALLEKYVIPGGSSGFFTKEGYTFDVGSSVMFGFGNKGNVNLITRALAAVGRTLEVLEDPVAVHYHMPNHLSVKVHRSYDEFIAELTDRFPEERVGIRKFYDECWTVFNALNSLELKSLEEPLYLLGQFVRKPIACLTLAWYLPQNAGDIARKHIRDPNLLSFIDAECFIVSTVDAARTPMINAAMVLCDRHYGGINYPKGGVGRIALELTEALESMGGHVEYRANVKEVVVGEDGRAVGPPTPPTHPPTDWLLATESAEECLVGGAGAVQVGVQLADGRQVAAKAVISNATRWDTFEKLVPRKSMPLEEAQFQTRYRKAPSFLSIHMGVDAAVLPPGTDCHHLVLEGLSPSDYIAKKEEVADRIVERLEVALKAPGLKQGTHFREVGTPRTHRRFLNRDEGTYGPIPARRPKGLLGMPFNTTGVKGLYCVGDSCFPGQGVIAVAFSGIMCGHRVAADLDLEERAPLLDKGLSTLLRWFRSLA